MSNHLKIGSAILSPDYFWMAGCSKCTAQPEVHHQACASGPTRKLEPRTSPEGLSSFRYDLSEPGLYWLRNFCGGGFRFNARVRVEGDSVVLLHLQGAAEC